MERATFLKILLCLILFIPLLTRVAVKGGYRRPHAGTLRTGKSNNYAKNMKTITKTILFLQLSAILLVTTLAGPAQKARPFKGSVEAVEASMVQFPTFFVDASGAGHASHLGRFTFTYEATVHLPTSMGVGRALLIAANGDRLLAEFTGQGHPTGTTSFIVETFTIIGGTGRFEGATGSFTLERLLNRVTGVTVGSFKGTISY